MKSYTLTLTQKEVTLLKYLVNEDVKNTEQAYRKNGNKIDEAERKQRLDDLVTAANCKEKMDAIKV